MIGIDETARAAKSFFDALKEQPLSLALVVSNFVLLIFLFYNGATISSARQETVKMIVEWQERTDGLMANCVSKDVLDAVVGALERQLAEMRRQLNGGAKLPPDDPVPLPPPRPPQPQPQQ